MDSCLRRNDTGRVGFIMLYYLTMNFPRLVIKQEPVDNWFATDAKEAFDSAQSGEWHATDGELALDVSETDAHIIVEAPIAGVRPEDVSLAISGDMLTIRGSRRVPESNDNREYLYRECHWGSFSRSLILPCQIDVNASQALFQNGILTITLQKTAKTGTIPIVEWEG